LKESFPSFTSARGFFEDEERGVALVDVETVGRIAERRSAPHAADPEDDLPASTGTRVAPVKLGR